MNIDLPAEQQAIIENLLAASRVSASRNTPCDSRWSQYYRTL